MVLWTILQILFLFQCPDPKILKLFFLVNQKIKNMMALRMAWLFFSNWSTKLKFGLQSFKGLSNCHELLHDIKLATCLNWAATWQNQQNDCAPSEDSDQPGYPPSLIRIFTVRMKKAWVLSYPFSTQRRLWSDWANAQADLSLCWAHSHFVGFVMKRLNWLRFLPVFTIQFLVPISQSTHTFRTPVIMIHIFI